MRPAGRGCVSSGAHTVSAMPACAHPATETMSPALATARSSLPKPERFQILVIFVLSSAFPGCVAAFRRLSYGKVIRPRLTGL